MATKKITDLVALTSADSTDVLPIVDVSANTTKKVTVDGLIASGSVTTAKLADGAVTSQKTKTTVAFFAYLGVSQITSNSTFKVALGAELYDQGSNYDTTQYRFVAPVAGVYHFDMTASAGNASTMRLTPTIYKNGTQLMIGPTLDVPYVSCELHTDLKLNANDYIEFYLACNNVAGLNFGTAPLSTYMSGHLVGTTS